MHPFKSSLNPHLAHLLERLNLDKTYVKGEGQVLVDSDGVSYLDFVSAYGALPFGHNPSELWETLRLIQESLEPSMVQPSYLDAGGELAKQLIELAPQSLKYVCFANSGAEANEAAIKACRSATGKKTILATDNGFHGKTEGALSATGKKEYQDVFFLPTDGYEYIPFGNAAALYEKLSIDSDKIAAFIVEPIQGEGGVVVPPPGYLTEVREICDRFGVLLILDEIQTGLGRTGYLFAAEREGILPDCMTLAKALGGGLLPIGACLLSDKAYNAHFALKHSSTFAANTLACRIGLKVLAMLTKDQGAVIRGAGEMGKVLKEGLKRIVATYPEVFGSVRGEGLMLGVEFKISPTSYEGQQGKLISFLARNESLTPLVASYLLNVEKLRVMPTLNGKSVLRIQPPLNLDPKNRARLLQAFERVGKIIKAGRTDILVAHLLGEEHLSEVFAEIEPLAKKKTEVVINEHVQANDNDKPGRFAFLLHLLHERSYADFDSSLERLTNKELAELSRRWNGLAEPAIIGTTRITSLTGDQAYGEFIVIQRTAEQLLALEPKESLAELTQATRLALNNGAGIIGLGGYTSVVTQGGRLLLDTTAALTTGNSYTVLASIDAVKKLVLV